MNNQFDVNTLYGLDQPKDVNSQWQTYNYWSTKNSQNNFEPTQVTQLVPSEQVVSRDDTGISDFNPNNLPKRINVCPNIQNYIPPSKQNGCAQCGINKQSNQSSDTTSGIPSPIKADNNEKFVLIESHSGLTETPVTLLQNRDTDNDTDNNTIDSTNTNSLNNTETGVADMNNMDMNNPNMANANMSGIGIGNTGMPSGNLGSANLGTGIGSGTGVTGIGANLGVSGLDQNILTGTDTAELGLFLRNLINSIQGERTPLTYSATSESLQYLNGFLRTQIGKLMEVEFLIGTNTTVIKRGYLTAVGANYLILQDVNSRQMTVCDFYNIKFATFYL